ncbi:MAG: hypothetical protein AB8B62_19295 [Roseobacter sp.]
MTPEWITRRIAGALSVIFVFTFSGLPGVADPVSQDAASRRAAETLALWAVENDADMALLSGLSGLLAAGATLDPDDPWRAFEYAQILRNNAQNDPQLLHHLSLQLSQTRGVVDGISRIDAVIEPGETLTVMLQMAQDEMAFVEARIKRDGSSATIDLIIKSETGETLASDIGPTTGVEDIGTFAQWFSEHCEHVEVIVFNTGPVPARVVMMAPPSLQNVCEAHDN